jgi:hypothetical protein
MTLKEYFSITLDGIVILQSSLSVDTAIEELFLALILGGSILILPSARRDIDGMIKTIVRHVYCVPP